MLKYKHFEASRELRLWLTQVILPIGLVVLATNDDARKKLNEGVNGVVNGITGIFNK